MNANATSDGESLGASRVSRDFGEIRSVLRQRPMRPLTIRRVALLAFIFGLLVGEGGVEGGRVWLYLLVGEGGVEGGCGHVRSRHEVVWLGFFLLYLG